MPETRSEILAVASELFGRYGYQRTSLREIAARLGVSKAAVLYHFPAKADILAALAQPLLDDIDAALASARAAGPDADLAGRVRAAQAIAMLSDPVMILADVPADALRAEILNGVRRLFAAPQPVRRKAGRPSRLGPEQLELARRLHEQGEHTGDEIAAAVGVSRATLYRHLSQ